MRRFFSFLSRYGTFAALLLLCAVLSILTLREQSPSGEAAGEQVAASIRAEFGPQARVLVAIRGGIPEERRYAETIERLVSAEGGSVSIAAGGPSEIRQQLTQSTASHSSLQVVAATKATADWMILKNVPERFPALGPVAVVQPKPHLWPTFLLKSNLLNVADQITVIAILAIAMTFVIIAGGIDLSVGSLIALSSVVAAVCVRDLGGGAEARVPALIGGAAAGIVGCGILGLLAGLLIVFLEIPPFIVTLAMMMVARGAAYLIADGKTIPELPAHATWLGRGVGWLGIPHAVVLMVVLYVLAQLALSRTVWGRHLYAVGGNRQAAWLSGIPVATVIVSTYCLSGLLAGLGGIIIGSNHQSGDPRYGDMYELYVIAAVVVGGTSLSGGRGTVVGTLIGALIIGVINNGMNLLEIDTYAQRIILGLVILAAVVLDRFQKRGERR